MKPKTTFRDWFSTQERALIEATAKGQLLRGEVLNHGRVVFYGEKRLRVERSFEELTANQLDREFLKVNRIAGSGL